MTDRLRDRLQRLGDRAEERSDALERLRNRRERRERGRRVGALVVAFAIAVAGTALVLSLRGDGSTTAVGNPSERQTTAWQPPEVLTVWPENPVQGPAPEEAQAQVDAGAPDLAWRLDPEQVAEHFAHTFMGWDAPSVYGTKGGDWTVSSCPPGADCATETILKLQVLQPVREGDGGIWSVTSVASGRLRTELGPEDPPAALAGGESAKWSLDIPNDVSANLGISTRNGCGQTGSFQGGAGPGLVALEIPAPNSSTDMDPSCGSIGAGYAFAYTTPPGFVATGDPLLEPGDILDVTIVPLYLRMIDLGAQPSGDVTDVAKITCDGATTTVDAEAVAAQPDGVHIEITNTSNLDLGFEFESGGRNADRGTTDLVESLAPGPQRVRCFDTSLDRATEGAWAWLNVVDPNAYWVDPELDCAAGESISSSAIDYAERPEGIADPIEAGRDALAHYLQDGDQLELGGYPEARGQKTVVLVRDGKVLASTNLERGTVGWYNGGVSACEGV